MTKKEEFKRNGYIVIKNAFNKDEIANLRKLSYDAFNNEENKNKRQLFNTEFVKNPDLLNPLFKKNILDEVKNILGNNYITYADFQLGNNLHSPVWHTDAQSIGFSTKYVYNKSFNIAKLGLYLQEDDDIYGGQLDIIPGSHLPSFLGVKSLINSKRSSNGKVGKFQLLSILVRNKFLAKKSVNISTGDLLLFHALLWHRSSQPKWDKLKQINRYGIQNPPRDKRKFMFQWEVSENNEFARYYATHKFRESNKNSHDANKFNIEDYSTSSKSLFKSNKINIKTFSDLNILEVDNLKSSDGTPIIFNN